MAEPDEPDFLPTQPWPEQGEAPTTPASPSPAPPNPRPRRGGWQPPAPEELQPSFPQYEIRSIIGRGGMGAVYQGWQKSLRRLVAIKILPPQLEDDEINFAERFQREAQAMARFAHPNIVGVHDAGETPEGLLYFIMEYVEGTDVQKLLASQGHLSPNHALSITAHVCDALAYAHRRGVIHRDIKPSNIMVDADGQVKVADFGLAKVATDDSGALHTGTHVRMGTPDFMAPESMMGLGRVDHRADLYAVGVMLYQMLTGRLPRGRFDPPSHHIRGLDVLFDGIVDHALQTDPDKRYSSAGEIRTDLDRIITQSAPPGATDAPQTPANSLTTAAVAEDQTRPNPQTNLSSGPPDKIELAANEKPISARRRGTMKARLLGCSFSLAIAFAAAVFAGAVFFNKPWHKAAPLASSQPQSSQVASTPPVGQPNVSPIPQKPGPSNLTSRFDELVFQGKQLRDHGDMNAAIIKFREAGTVDAKSPVPLAELAATYEKMSLSDKAVEYWRKLYEMGDAAGTYYSLAGAKLKGTGTSVVNYAAGHPPTNATDTSATIAGIAAGATFGLLEITAEDQRDNNSAKHFVLHIPIKARPNAHINVRDLLIQVLFYDIVAGKNVVATSANINSRWATPPADWANSDTEELSVEYQLPKPQAQTIEREKPEYFGYIVRIYYQQQLQAAAAQPERLAQQYPPALWPTYAPGKAPSGRLLTLEEVDAFADRSPISEILYLRGAFRVTASGPSRAVLRDANKPDSESSRVIVEYPPGVKPLPETVRLVRDSAHPYLITDIRRGSDGVVSVFTREIIVEDAGGIPATGTPEPEGAAKSVAPSATPKAAESAPTTVPVSLADLLTSPDYQWSKPENLGPGVNTAKDDYSPGLSDDGLILVFSSTRNGKEHLFECRRKSVEELFGNAVPVKDLNIAGEQSGPFLTGDGLTLLYHSTEGRNHHGGSDIYQSHRRSRETPWEQPTNLGSTINTTAAEEAPCLSPDGLTLLFHSNRAGGQGGYDLWRSRRKSLDAPFESPANLGKGVNTDGKEFSPCFVDSRNILFVRSTDKSPHKLFLATPDASGALVSRPIDLSVNGGIQSPTLSPDGRILYFASDMPGGQGGWDLWQIRRQPKTGQ